jgi:hypothetical protein
MTLRYRLLRSLFATSKHWKLFDPFFAQKLNTYKASGTAVHRMNTFPSVHVIRLAYRATSLWCRARCDTVRA